MNSPSVAEAMDPGRRLGHYEIQAKLGSGGMGTVYQALDTRLNRAVALKVLSPDKWEGTSGRGRLIREAQAASALNHPNIVTVYEVGHDADVDFIAMERVEGRRSKRSPQAPARGAARRHTDCRRHRRRARRRHRASRSQAAQHHGDRTRPGEDPGFRNRQGQLAGDSESSTHANAHQPGQVLGTVAYMSPEQAAGKEVDWRSDIFSFGSVLYEMITGRRAFHEDTDLATMAAVIAKDPTPATANRLRNCRPPWNASSITACARNARIAGNPWSDVKLLLASALADLDLAAPPRARVSPLAGRGAGGGRRAACGRRDLVVAAPGRCPGVGPGAAAGHQFGRAQRLSGALARRQPAGLRQRPQRGGQPRHLVAADRRTRADSPDDRRRGRQRTRRSPPTARAWPSAANAPAEASMWCRRWAATRCCWRPAAAARASLPTGTGSPTGRARESADLLPGTARVFVIESGGGQARQIGADLAAALYPVWSPAGDQVLVLGRAAAGAAQARTGSPFRCRRGPRARPGPSPHWPRSGWCSPHG